jgi:hypothetical protein
MAVEVAVLVVGHSVLVRERPEDAGAGAGGGPGRQHGRGSADHGRGHRKGICERINPRSSSACFRVALVMRLGVVAMSVPSWPAGRWFVAHPAKHDGP